MGKVPLMAMVIGMGAIGFAAASQTGDSTLTAQHEAATASVGVSSKYLLSGCRIERVLKYDFNGDPYLKKVRICA